MSCKLPSLVRFGAFSLALFVSGCALPPVGAPRTVQAEGRIVTAEQIARSSARDAWDVLRLGHLHLHIAESSGRPARVLQRGPVSFLSSEAPVIAVDGIRTAGFDMLRSIPAHHIAAIRVLSGPQATWMNWTTPDGLTSPAPATFLGGTQEMPEGSTAYFTVDLRPGRYAWIAEVDDPAGKNMLKTFTVPIGQETGR